MSSLIVEICKIDEVYAHPEADRLELCKIKGWQMVIGKGVYKPGDLVIFIPPDSILPIELSDKLGVTKYLSKQKVKSIKLVHEISHGLIADLSVLPEGYSRELYTDVKDVLGIQKWEPPEPPLHMSGIIRCHDPNFCYYIDIENINNFPDVLIEGELVSITEKVHGTSIREMNLNGEFLVGSRKVDLEETDDNLYWKASKIYNLKEILKPGYQSFGEVYGPNIQKNFNYDKQNIDIMFYDLMIDYKYVDYNIFKEFCDNNNLPTVPVIYTGPWNNNLKSLAMGQSTIASHIREGFVVKPLVERFDGRIGRVILKCISDDYASLKKKTDFH